MSAVAISLSHLSFIFNVRDIYDVVVYHPVCILNSKYTLAQVNMCIYRMNNAVTRSAESSTNMRGLTRAHSSDTSKPTYLRDLHRIMCSVSRRPAWNLVTPLVVNRSGTDFPIARYSRDESVMIITISPCLSSLRFSFPVCKCEFRLESNSRVDGC